MIYELVNMKDWITKEKILKQLKLKGLELNERIFRSMVENINKNYTEHKSDVFIAHGSKGYKIASNDEEIRRSAGDHMARAIDQFTKYHHIKKALGENANFNFQIVNGEMLLMDIQDFTCENCKEEFSLDNEYENSYEMFGMKLCQECGERFKEDMK